MRMSPRPIDAASSPDIGVAALPLQTTAGHTPTVGAGVPEKRLIVIYGLRHKLGASLPNFP